MMMRVGSNMLVGRMYAIILALTISSFYCAVVEGCFGVHNHQKLNMIGKQFALIGRHDFGTCRRRGYHQQPRPATKDPNEVSRSSISSANLDRSNLCSKRMVKPRSALHEDSSRRSWLEQVTTSTVSLAAIWTGWSAVPESWADEGVTSSGVEEFVRQGPDYGYAIRFPEAFEQTQKPLKTHLDEINFISPTVKGYQVGITVDPVRINSLREFGTPEEVAAKVVLAEVNRDGVFDVTLIKDPVEVPGGGYLLDYLSQGKRGAKHFVVKVGIQRQKLYVLTAQAPEEVYKEVAPEMMEFVKSFRLL